MTNRERVIAAVKFQKTDFIPHQTFLTKPMLDIMVKRTGDPQFFQHIGNHVTRLSLEQYHEQIRPGFTKDEFGVIFNRTGALSDVGLVEDFILKDPEDFANYVMPTVKTDLIAQRMTALSKDTENFRVAHYGFSLFERAWTLRGMENILCDMIEEPEFVETLLDVITDRILRMLDVALEFDFECFYMGDDWGQQKGLIMGPKLWRKFIKPRVAKIYEKVHSAGKLMAQHSCGDIRDVMDDLIEIGLDIYNPFQSEILGYDYAKKLDGKVCVWGGVSTQQDLPFKTPKEIEKTTRDLLAAFPNGGLIAGPSHAITPDTPPENVEAMIKVFLEQNQE